MNETTIPPWVPPVTPVDGLAGQEDLRRITATTAAISTVVPVVYGEVQIGGRVFAATYANSTWYIGALFCLGEIDSFVNLYLNDAAPPTGCTVTYYTGTISQTADATLASVLSGYTDTLVFDTPRGKVGVAYVVITYSDAVFSGFPKIVARIRGRKVYAKAGNLIAFSEDITGTGWSAGNVDTGRTANAAVAPDGATTADKITEATTTATNHFVNAPTVADIPDYAPCTFSVFCKAAERTVVRVNMVLKSGGVSSVTVNLTTGAVLSTSGASFVDAGVIAHGDGWYRVWICSTVSTGATAVRGRILTMLDSVTQSYAGTVGSGLLVWGAQFERKRKPGIYTATSSTAAVPAFSANPALFLRDYIVDPVFGVGDDIDDVSVQAAYNDCESVVISQKRRQAGLVISAARSAEDWIATLASYAGCLAFTRGGQWVLALDRNLKLWQFTSTTHSFTGANGTLTAGATALTFTQTAGDMILYSPNFLASPTALNISGSQMRYVRARMRRTSGAGAVDTTLFYRTAFHSESVSFFKATLAWTVANGTWAIREWDMHQLSAGGSDWKESIIGGFRIDFTNSAATDVWEIDWISVGIKPLSNANLVKDSVKVVIADTAQTPTIVNVKYTDTTTTIWQERQAQSALAGVALGTVPPRESTVMMPGITSYAQAKREATERLNKLQRSAQIELSMFDEGIAFEVGDLVSLLHAYAGTASATENDDPTLYRIIAGPKISAPGRVDFRLAPFFFADFDDTEPTTTWNANTYAIGGINAPRSGDGINRVPGRFAGGFGTTDYDGQFSVTKGADVLYASVLNSTAPNPTAGFYGEYALKLATRDTATTDRQIWFGSSATNYSMAIDANSRWLFSCKFWPIVANTPVTVSLKTASATYTLSDTTSTASVWNDFIHTANSQNVFNLSADANVTALLGLYINVRNSQVFFDGLMLEKQISNGSIVSAWRPPVAAATNPTRISPRLLSTGTLDDSVVIDDGAGNARNIVAGAVSGACFDGIAVTFTPAYGRIPTVVFSPAALTYATGAGFGSAVNQTLVCEARSLSTSGFTPYLKVRTTATSTTARTDASPTDLGAAQVPRYVIQKAASAAEAWDDRYTFTVSCVIKNIRSGEPGYVYFEPGQMTVACYIATADSGSPLFTPTWTKVGTIVVGGGGGASTTTRTGQTLTVVRDGLTQRGGTCPEFGIAIESEANPGGSVTFTSVTYETAVTGPTETSATAAGVSAVPFTVIPT